MEDDDVALENDALDANEQEAAASEEEEQSSALEEGSEELEASAEGEAEESEGDEEDLDLDDDGDDEVVLEDVEYQGKAYKVPPELKGALMMHSDYTQKTQAVAEEKKALAEQQEQFNQQVESQQQLVGEYAELYAVGSQIQQYSQMDWAKLEQEDPFQANQMWREFQMLKDRHQNVTNDIQRKEHERSQKAQQETAKRNEEYQIALQREFKDWSPQLNQDLTNYARSMGFTDQEISSIRDIRTVKALRKAMEGDQLREKLKKQREAAKKAKPKEEVKPLKKQAQGRTSSATSGLSDDISMDEWMKRREKQIASQRRY